MHVDGTLQVRAGHEICAAARIAYGSWRERAGTRGQFTSLISDRKNRHRASPCRSHGSGWLFIYVATCLARTHVS